MKIFRIFRYKNQLKEFARQNKIVDAIDYLQNIKLTGKERIKLKRCVINLFNDEDAYQLLLLLEARGL